MPRRPFLSIAEQVASHLREELLRGRWSGTIPGRHQIAHELGLNNKTVAAALKQLEVEGLLVTQGAGRRRIIQLPPDLAPGRVLKIALLLHDPLDRGQGHMVDLQHLLTEAGHQVIVPARHLTDLRMDVRRVARLVQRTPADAWIVVAGSFEVLELFLTNRIPVFALFGRRRELLIPGVGPDKPPAYAAATRELIRLGHRRIVLMCAPERRIPEPGASERAFLAELAAHEIPLGRYQLPEWDGTIDDFHQRLESLFHYSAPTALIIDEAPLFAATLQFLGRHHLRVPEDVSLVCTDHADWFDALRPSVAHIRWDDRPVLRRILQWARNLSRGRQDIRQVETPAEFVPGGTIGEAR